MVTSAEWARWRALPDRPSLPATLLAADYTTRVRTGLALARAAATGDTDAEATLDALSRGDALARRISAKALYAYAPSERLLRLANDASRFVWGVANKALATQGSAEDVQVGLETAWATRRHTRVLGWLQSAGRHAEIGRFVTWMIERGASPEWVDWLPAADAATLHTHLAAALDRPSARFWTRLARVEPEVLVSVALRALNDRPGASASPPDGQLRVVLRQNLRACARAAPDATLGLVRTLHDRGAPVELDVWRVLVDRRPNEALAAWWALGQRWSTTVDADALTTDTLVTLLADARAPLADPQHWMPARSTADRARIVVAWAEALPRHPRQLPWMFRWFEAPTRAGRGVDPGRDGGVAGAPEAPSPETADARLALWEAWSVANRDTNGILPFPLAEVLPPDLARREALRHIHEVAALATRPLERMAWMALLSYADVEPLVRPYLGHPEPETRGPAVATLIRVCGQDPARPDLATIGLELVLARKFEQDPVRGRMFNALVAWPKAIWRAEHLPLLTRALRDALDAADLSNTTVQPMERVLLDRFSLDPAWAARELQTLLKERGYIYQTGFAARLSDAELDVALPAIVTVARTWRGQERWPMVTALCEGVGHRLPRAPALGELLAEMACSCPTHHWAEPPWRCLAQHDPARASTHRVAVATAWARRGWRPNVLSLIEARDPAVVLRILEARVGKRAVDTRPSEGPGDASPPPRRWSAPERTRAVADAPEPEAAALVPLLTSIISAAKTNERWLVIRALRELQRAGAPTFDTLIASIAGTWPLDDLASLATALGPVVSGWPEGVEGEAPRTATPPLARDLPLTTGGGTPGRATSARALRTRACVPEVLATAIVRGCASRGAPEIGTALARLRPKHYALFAEAAAAALAADPSVIAFDLVRTWAHRYAQPLLTPALGGAVVTGKWATGRTSWLFSFEGGQFRWEPAQQARWAASAAAEITSADRDTPTRLALLDQLPNLAWIPSPLPGYAEQTTPVSPGRSAPGFSAVEPDFASAAARSAVGVSTEPGIRGVEPARSTPVIRERATRLLGRVDAGGGVPTLLACLADDRARWAIYSLRRGLRSLPSDAAAALLLQAPRRQVTVAKEVVRLLGELRGDAGARALITLSRTNVHRDVRIALLRGLWDHLDHEETWEIYAEAAAAPDHILASRLGDVPADRLTRATDRRLSALYAKVVARPEPEARIDALRRAPGLALRDADRALFQACFARLDTRYVDELTAAVEAVTLRLEESDEAFVAAALPALAANRRAFVALIHHWRARTTTRSVRTVYAGALTTLLPDPQLTAELIGDTALFGVERFIADVARAAVAERLNALALIRARGVVEGLARPDAAAVLATWAAHTDPRLRLLALAAVVREAALAGWTVATREALVCFQGDGDPMVAGAARLVFPPEETPEDTTEA